MDTYLNYANASPAQFGATFGGSYFNPLEGQSSNILDSIIGRRMENVEPMRAKIRKFYEQEQMQKQQKELAEERDKQAKIGATVKAVKEGASLLKSRKLLKLLKWEEAEPVLVHRLWLEKQGEQEPLNRRLSNSEKLRLNMKDSGMFLKKKRKTSKAKEM